MTVPQFRILAAIKRGLQYTSQIAEHQGVSQPTMFKMVNGSVKRGLVKRLSEKDDRRQRRKRRKRSRWNRFRVEHHFGLGRCRGVGDFDLIAIRDARVFVFGVHWNRVRDLSC